MKTNDLCPHSRVTRKLKRQRYKKCICRVYKSCEIRFISGLLLFFQTTVCFQPDREHHRNAESPFILLLLAHVPTTSKLKTTVLEMKHGKMSNLCPARCSYLVAAHLALFPWDFSQLPVAPFIQQLQIPVSSRPSGCWNLSWPSQGEGGETPLTQALMNRTRLNECHTALR